MSQTQQEKSEIRKKKPMTLNQWYRIRRIVASVLSFAMVFGNVGNSANIALAGDGTAREEFRIHADEIMRAAEQALSEGNPVSGDLGIGGKDKSLVKEYETLFAADGSLYEIFPVIDTVKGVDGIDLRVFMRIDGEADPESYALTGEEKLLFLYVNDGDETVAGRLNIDGQVSGFTTVKPYDAVFGQKQLPDALGAAGAGNGTEESTSGEEAGDASDGSDESQAPDEAGDASESGESGNDGSGEDGEIKEDEPEAGTSSDEGSQDSGDRADAAEPGDQGTGGSEADGGDESGGSDESGKAEDSEDSDNNKSDSGSSAGDKTDHPAADSADTGSSADEKGSDSVDTGSSADDKGSDSKDAGSGSDDKGTDSKDSGSSADDKGTDSKDAGSGSDDKGADSKDSGSSADDKGSDSKDSGSSADDKGTDSKDTGSGSDDKGADSQDSAGSSSDKGNAGGEDSENKSAGTGSSDRESAKDTSSDRGSSDSKDTGNSSSDSKDSGDSSSDKGNSDSKDSGGSSSDKGSSDSQDSGSGSSDGGEKKEALGISLNQIRRVADSLGSGSDAEDAEDTEDEEEDEDEDSNGDPFDAEDAAALVNEEKSFNKTGNLSGRTYNLVSLDDSITARAFVLSFSQIGFAPEELEEAAHQITYSIDPVGSAALVKAAKSVKDGAEVTFGVKPQVGYRVTEVTANGDALETADVADGTEGVVWYTIPEVLESQEVDVVLTEMEEGGHPEYAYSKTLGGVKIDLFAEEGILPAGTRAEVKEVTAQVEEAVKEKVEESDEVEAVTAVLAYDITLYDASGNKLDDSWSQDGYVKVSFSGAQIEENSKEADAVEIRHVDTDVDATREIVKAEEIASVEKVAETVEVAGERTVSEVSFEAEHFSVYMITFTSNKKSADLDIVILNQNGDKIDIGSEKLDGPQYTLSKSSKSIKEIKDDFEQRYQDELTGYEYKKATSDKNGYSELKNIYYYDGKLYKNSEYKKRNIINTIYFWYKEPEIIKVTFDPNIDLGGIGNQYTASLEPVENQYIMELPEPESIGITANEGYVFAGWSTNKNGQNSNYVAGLQQTFSKNTTMYAIWLNPNQSSDNIAYFYIRKDGEIQYEPAGYDGSNYYPLNSGTTLQGKLKNAVAVNNNLEAVKSNLEQIPSDDKIKSELKKHGINFDPQTQYIQWYVIKYRSAEGQKTYWNVDGVICDRSKYRLSYNPNGGDTNCPGSNQFAEGQSVDISFKPIPNRVGYTFLGWDTDNTVDTPRYTEKGNRTIRMPGEDVVLYAIWKPNQSTQYFVEDYLENEEGKYPESPLRRTSKYGQTDSVVTLTGVEAPAYEGYVFDEAYSGNRLSGTITPDKDNPLILKRYFKRAEYTYVENHIYDGEESDENVENTYKYGVDISSQKKEKNGYLLEEIIISPETETVNMDLAAGTVMGNMPNHDLIVTYRYIKRQDLSYTVNYLEKGTNKKLKEAKVAGNQTYDTVITSEKEKINIDGYEYDSADKESITITTGSNIINLYYTKRQNLSYTVNYLDKATNEAVKQAKVTGNQTFGTGITSESEKVDIDGYQYDSAESESITITTGSNVINLYYTKRQDLSYTVNYLDKDTNKAVKRAKVTENQTFGTEIISESEKVDIDGYEYINADKEKLTITTGENIINLYYAAQPQQYLVHYYKAIEAEGGELTTTEISVSDSVTKTGVTAQLITERAKDISGYTPVDTSLYPKEQHIILGPPDRNGDIVNIITFYYTANDQKYIVQHVDEDSLEILETSAPKTTTFGEIIDGKDEKILIPGFVFTKADSLVIGTNDEENVVTVYYSRDEIGGTNPNNPDEPDRIPDKYQVIYTYESADTSKGTITGTWKEVHTIYEVTTNPDGTITVGEETPANPSAAVNVSLADGYEISQWVDSKGTVYASLDEIKANAFAEDMTFTVSFKEKAQTYMVRFLDDDHEGEEVAPAVGPLAAVFGQEIKGAEQKIAVEGYVFVRADNLIVGTDNAANIVTLYYSRDEIGGTDPDNPDWPDGIPDKYQIIFRYISEDENRGTVSGTQMEVHTIYELTTSEDGTITAAGPNPVNPGANVTVVPAEGYRFVNWTAEPAGLAREAGTTFDNTAAIRSAEYSLDTDFIAHFAEGGSDDEGDKPDDNGGDDGNRPGDDNNNPSGGDENPGEEGPGGNDGTPGGGDTGRPDQPGDGNNNPSSGDNNPSGGGDSSGGGSGSGGGTGGRDRDRDRGTGGTGEAGGTGETGTDTIAIDPETVPLASLPDDINDAATGMLILDEDVPLFGLPKTGDNSIPMGALMGMMFVSFFGALGIAKKRKEDER